MEQDNARIPDVRGGVTMNPNEDRKKPVFPDHMALCRVVHKPCDVPDYQQNPCTLCLGNEVVTELKRLRAEVRQLRMSIEDE